MIRIGKLTDYALLILSQLARSADVIMSASILAETLHLSPPTVSKILKILSDAGLVRSVRGSEGGYHLSRAASSITVADIIAAMEGAFSLTECCEGEGLCSIDYMCTLRDNWRTINKRVENVLAQVSIADMLQPLKAG